MLDSLRSMGGRWPALRWTRRGRPLGTGVVMAIGVKFHHIGITVTNLERTLAFFEDAFGLVAGMALRVHAGAKTARALGLPEHEQRVALLAVGDVILELIEFHPVRRAAHDGRQDDVGYAYPCFAVQDIDAAY